MKNKEEIKQPIETVEEVGEEAPKPKPRKKKKEDVFCFNESEFYTEALINGVVTKVFKPEFEMNKLMRCRIQTARKFDTTIDQIKKAYEILNGKKLDGFYIDTLIDRHGFSNGIKASRKEVCEKNKVHLNQKSVDIAEKKLSAILKASDVRKSYVTYVKEMKDELERGLKEKAIYGESENV